MLGIAGIVIMIVMIYQTYKTARDNGRNASLWALAVAAVGIGFQFVIPFIVGILLGIVMVMRGTSDPTELQSQIIGPATIIGIVCLAISVVGMWIIFKHVMKVPDVPFNADVPPPPPSF
jgi:hypothetical protein